MTLEEFLKSKNKKSDSISTSNFAKPSVSLKSLLEQNKNFFGTEADMNRITDVVRLLKENPDSVVIGNPPKTTPKVQLPTIPTSPKDAKQGDFIPGRIKTPEAALPEEKHYVSKDIYDAAVKFNEEYDKETKRVEAEEADAENKSKTLQFLAEIDAKWNGGASNQEIADETITAIVDNRNSHTYYKKEQNSISVEDVKKVAAQIKNKPKQTQTLLSVGGIPKEIYDLAVIYNNMLDRRSGLLSAADIEAIKLAYRYESIGATPGKNLGGIGFADAVDKYITSEDLNSKEYNDLVQAYRKGNVEELMANNKVFTGKILLEDIWEKINPRKVVGTGSDGTKFYNKYAYNQYLESQRMNNKEAEVIKNIRKEHHIISGIQELAAKKATEAFAKDKKLNATVHNIINGHKSVDVRDQYYKYSKLTEAEKLIYNYYVMQQTSDMDSSIAGKYLKEIDSRLEERAAVDLAEDMNGLEKTLHMAGQGIESGMLNVARAGAGLKGEELSSLYDETDQERLSRAIINGEDNDVARFFYQAIQTTSEQLPSIGLGVATNGVGYFAMLSTSVVGSSVTEAMRNNKTLIEGVTYGTVQAVMEIALDKLLGGIGGKFLGKGLSNVVVKTLDKIDNIFTSKIPKNLLKGAVVHLESAGGEGLQEFIQGIADPAIRNVIYQENNTYSLDTLGEALYQGLLGFASGFALGGSNASMAQTQAQYETIGNGLIDTHGVNAAQNVLKLAQEVNNTKSELYRDISEKVAKGKEVTPEELGQLSMETTDLVYNNATFTKETLKFMATEGSVKQISDVLFDGNTEAAEIFKEKFSDSEYVDSLMFGENDRVDASFVEKSLNPAAPEIVDSGNNQGYNNNTNIDQNGGNVNVDNLDRRGTASSNTQSGQSNGGGEVQGRRTWTEDAESFRRRTEAIGTEGRGRQTVEIGETLFSYIPKDFDGSQASKAVEILNRAGIKAVYCEGDTESNSAGNTTVHTEATTGPDGTVYVSSNSSLSAIQIAAHEAIHSKDILNSQEYLEFEAVVCDNILWGSDTYIDLAKKINDGHYNGKYDITGYDFGGPFVKELMGYVNGFISEDATKAAEIFAPMFSNWEAVVEASRKFNEAIGLDFSDVDISGTTTEAADNSSVNEYNNTNTDSENGGFGNENVMPYSEERGQGRNTGERSGVLQADLGGNYDQGRTAWSEQGKSSPIRSGEGGRNRSITPEQTESLKSSAIKNADGSPKAVYHFTDNMEFDVFAKGDIGFHFGNETQAVARGSIQNKSGRTITAYLDIKNPIQIPSDIMCWRPRNLAFRLVSDGIISERDFDTVSELDNTETYEYNSPAAVELRRILSEKGYDGIVYQNMFEGDGESYIAFYPEQVIIIDDGKGNVNSDIASTDTLAHPAPTAGKVLKMTPVSARAKNYVKAIGEALGWKVEFGPVRTPKGGKADGKINRNTKTLTIDPTSEKPIEFIFKHELAHILEQDKGAYADLQNAIMDSKAFKDYVKSLGFETVSAYNADIVARYRTEGVKGFDSAMAEYKANCEMVANFVGDCLFGGNNEVTAKLLEGMNQPQRRSFIQWVKEFFAKLKDKLSGKSKQLTDEISELENAFLKVLNSVGQKENTAETDGESYSIATDSKNRKVVVLDRNIFKGVADLKARAEALEDWIIKCFGGTKHNTSDYFFVVMNERTAGKMKFWNENMDAVAYERKLSAAEHIDELIKISKFDRYSKNVKDKHKAFADKGWNYFKSYFTDGERIYEADISVAKSKEQSVVYNIGYIKDVGKYEPNNKSSYSLTGSPNESVTIPASEASNRNSTDRISQKDQSVNSNSMQENEDYSNSSAFAEQEDTVDADDESYSLQGYSQHQIDNWSTSKNIVVYKNEQQLRQFVRDALKNQNLSKKIYFGSISKNLAARIKRDTGIDVEKYNCTLRASEIKKIIKDHGNEEKEYLRGQRKITEDDFVLIPTIIQQPDEIVLSDDLFEGKPVINFIKTVNGKTTVTAYVSAKHLDLTVQTMYSGKNKGNLAIAAGDQAPANTPEANAGTVPNNSISNSNENVNYSISAPSKVEDVLTRFKNGEITQDEAVSLLSKEKILSPYDIAHLKPEDAEVTSGKGNPKREGNGDRESRFYASALGSEIITPEIKAEIEKDTYIKNYQGTTNKRTLSIAAKELSEGGQERAQAFKELAHTPEKASAVDVAVGFILLEGYQRVGNEAAALETAEILAKIGTGAGQTVQLFSIMGRFTPETMIAYVQKDLDKAYEKLVELKSEKWAKNYKDRMNLTEEDIEFIRRRTLQAAMLEDGTRPKEILLAEIVARATDKIPPENGQSLRALQRVSLLLNVRTQLRNVVGNANMVPIFVASDFFGSLLDRQLAKTSGVRTTGNFKFKGRGEAFVRGLAESYDDFKRGIRTRREELNRYDVNGGAGKNFNEHHKKLKQLDGVSRALNKLDNFTSFCLEAGDRSFFEMWFTNSINNQLRLNKTDIPTEEMIEIAREEALQRTWQDNNVVTRSMSQLKKNLNNIRIGKTTYGFGDFVLKFVKTPANIGKAMVEFSPVGFAMATAKGVRYSEALKTGKLTAQMQKELVRSMSNAFTGTVLYALVAVLASLGVIELSGGGDEDKDVSNFEKYIVGVQPYSVKIFGVDVTYSWNQPMGTVLATVADFMESKKDGNDALWYEDVWNAFKTGATVFTEQSFLSSLYELFSADDMMTGISEAALSEPAAFIPQIVSQTASFTDPYRRTTYESGKPIQSAINSIIYKIPGLRQALPEQVNVMGETVENNQYLNPWKAFIDPSTSYGESSGAVAEEIYKLYKATGDKTVMPRTAPNDLSIEEKKIVFSAEEKADFQRTIGEKSCEILKELFNSEEYKALSDAKKAKAVAEVYEYAYAKAKAELDIYDYEMLSKIVGTKSNGEAILTKEVYDRLDKKARQRLIDEEFLSKLEIKCNDDPELLAKVFVLKVME